MASVMGADKPRDKQAREECISSVIEGFLNTGLHRQLKLMVIGEAGQGKSTLINALIGQEVAKEGENFKAGTNSIQEYRLEQNDVQIAIWDTPGFGMESKEEDEKTVELLRNSDCYPIDLALFCFRMDGTRFPTRVHTDTIQKITEVFDKSFWQHCLFVLTFGNNVEQLCPDGEELAFFFSNRVLELEKEFQKALKKHAGLTDVELERIRAVPVGSYKQGMFRKNPWALPDREDWFVMFWIECTDHMRNCAVPILLQVNRHRLQAQEPQDTNGFTDPPSHLEVRERIIGASPKEILDIDIQMSQDRYIRNLTQEDIKKNAVESNVPFVQPDSHTEKDGIDGNKGKPELEQQNLIVNIEDNEATATPQEPNLHTREIPLRIILQRQLDDRNSSFYEYVTAFAKKRGGSVWGFGHVTGFIEGFTVWLGRKGRNS